MHIGSLPSEYGIGALGRDALSFVDFLADCGVGYWQTLPIGVTSYGDSPYQSPSAFAGNPYFIDLDTLFDEGLLTKRDLDAAKPHPSEETRPSGIDYKWLYNTRYDILRAAFGRFTPDDSYDSFVRANSYWLSDFALFMAVKAKFGGEPFDKWPKKFRYRGLIGADDTDALKKDVEYWYFLQYQFDKQMTALKNYAAAKGVKLIGDIPIYVAYDSADVWANPKLFKLDRNLKPTYVAGVPPDYFAAKGQLWGNPLYDWKKHAEDGYSWWHSRIQRQLVYFDKIRIDHFRGFDSYYKVPYGSLDATVGKWCKGAGLSVFEGIREELEGRIIAEDLGMVTPSVKRMVKKSGFPSMKVFEFAFDGKKNNEHLPKKQLPNTVYYTGTHDNDTLKGWYDKLPSGTKDLVRAAVKEDDDSKIQYAILRSVMKSKADIVVVSMQDYLCQDSRARMNTPGTVVGNWQYFLSEDYKKCKKTIKRAVKYRPSL